MPFDASGRFMPANFAVQPTAAATPIGSRAAMAMTQAQPAAQNAMAARAYSSGGEFPTQNFGGQAISDVARRQPNWAQTSRFGFDPEMVQQPAPDPNPPAPPPQPVPPQGRGPGFDVGGGDEPGTRMATAPMYRGPQQYQSYGMSQLGAPAPQQMVGTQSPTQMAGRGNAQSVSNYLQALQQSGAAANNASMNVPGQLGGGPQGGFRGFGYQPGYGPNYVQQGYLGPMGPGLSYQANQAQTRANYNVGNYAQQGGYGQARAPSFTGGGVTAGGTGGVAGQPQFTIPQPWKNMRDPEQNPAIFENMSSDEKSAYLGAPREGGWGEDKPPQSYDWPVQQGSFYSASDERAKTNIQPAQAELEEFMNALGVYSYEYKDKSDGEGRYISPMAQEFEKSQLGAQAVVETPEGKKMVNYGKLMGVQTAALALLNHKYNSLEKKFNESMKTNLKNRKK